MLIDHIGYKILYPIYANTHQDFLHSFYYLLRSIGRISFPIFCFLLVEGFYQTRSRTNYALRLAIGAVIAEIPYNLFVSGQLFYPRQSVMLTLLLGFFMLLAMEQCQSLTWKPVFALPFAMLGQLLQADYGWAGIALIALFAISRYLSPANLVRIGGMLVLFHYMPSTLFWIGSFSLPMQVLGVFSMLFIGNYDGRKLSSSNVQKWGFYLFYPAHLLFLCFLSALIPTSCPV